MSKKTKVIIIVISIIMVAILGGCIYFIVSSNKKIEELSNELDTYKISNSNDNAQSAEFDNENVVVNENNNNTVNNKNTTNEVNNNTTTSKDTTNSNSNDTEYEKANAAIKKALKDQDWLIQNVFGLANDEAYFVKINDINSLPAYLIRCDHVGSDGLDGVRLITYINGAVHVSNNDNFDYVNVTYDPESSVVRMEEETDDGFGFDRGFVKYYKMNNNGEFECIKEFTFSDEEYGIPEKYGDPETVYLNEVKAYDANYNFTSISIKLTEQNIDKYVK